MEIAAKSTTQPCKCVATLCVTKHIDIQIHSNTRFVLGNPGISYCGLDQKWVITFLSGPFTDNRLITGPEGQNSVLPKYANQDGGHRNVICVLG